MKKPNIPSIVLLSLSVTLLFAYPIAMYLYPWEYSMRTFSYYYLLDAAIFSAPLVFVILRKRKLAFVSSIVACLVITIPRFIGTTLDTFFDQNRQVWTMQMVHKDPWILDLFIENMTRTGAAFVLFLGAILSVPGKPGFNVRRIIGLSLSAIAFIGLVGLQIYFIVRASSESMVKESLYFILMLAFASHSAGMFAYSLPKEKTQEE